MTTLVLVLVLVLVLQHSIEKCSIGDQFAIITTYTLDVTPMIKREIRCKLS